MLERALITAAFVAGASACNGIATEAEPAAPKDTATLMAPPRAGFDPVADVLVAACGTLDCHGQPGRNLRLFGSHGLRLSATDDPGGLPTSDAEREANYWSVIGLEPEMMDLVVRARGEGAARLSLVRKARGSEKHKGGTLTVPGDAFDQCLLGWLAGMPAEAPCQGAIPKRRDRAE